MKRFLVVLAILLLAFSLAGCKEDVQDRDTASRPSGSSGTDSDSSSGSMDSDVDEASSGSGMGEKITNYISKKENLEFSVKYEYSMNGNGMNENWEFNQYFGKNKYRMDSFANGQEGRFFFIDNQITSCTKDRSEWMCMQLPPGEEDEMNDPTESFTEIEDDLDVEDTTYKGTRRIAGTTAHCWGVDWDAYGTDGGMEVCYSKEGVPLYMKSEANGAVVQMEAQSYSTSVSDSDFRFPAEPMDMGAMMQQAYGGQMPEGMPDY